MNLNTLKVGDYVRDESPSRNFNGEIGIVINKTEKDLVIRWFHRNWIVYEENPPYKDDDIVYNLNNANNHKYKKISKKEVIVDLL